jgi:Tol biopolymer transport system component
MKAFVALLVGLVFVPAAAGSTILFASAAPLTAPVVVQVGVDGSRAKIVAHGSILAQSAQGRIATADGSSLLVDGKVVATVRGNVDEGSFSPDGKRVAFTATERSKCFPTDDEFSCAVSRLWVVRSNGTALRQLDNQSRFPRFSPDGKRLAFLAAAQPNGGPGMAVVEDLATGRRTRFVRVEAIAPVWAPDSNRIAVQKGGAILMTVHPRRVQPSAIYATPIGFSPDGKSLLAVNSEGLYAGVHRITMPPGSPFDMPALEAAWTAGNWIVYVGRDPVLGSANQALYRVRPDGTHSTVLRRFVASTKISLVRAGGGTVTFTQVNTRIGFATIDAVDPASGHVRVVRAESANDSSPAVSASGTLAYTRAGCVVAGRQCVPSRAGCLVVGRQCVTADAGRGLAWSPDGTEIAYVTAPTKDGAVSLKIHNVATGLRYTLRTFHEFEVRPPTWSPDGKTIVVPAWDENDSEDSYLYAVDVTTGAWQQLPVHGYAASYSPDGTKLAVLDFLGTGPALELYDVASAAITDLGVEGTHAPATDTRPAWSPDGSQIAYRTVGPHGAGAIRVIGVDGSGDRQVASGVDDGGALAWSN